MMKILFYIFTFLLLIPAPASKSAQFKELLIVVHGSAKIDSLSQKQVIDLFLGRNKFFPSGNKVRAIDHPINSQLRADFYQALTGKNIATIDAYWARLKYSGRANSPKPLTDIDEIINAVSEQVGTIAYLPADSVQQIEAHGLKTVLTMNIH